jgi:hypothetical protein
VKAQWGTRDYAKPVALLSFLYREGTIHPVRSLTPNTLIPICIDPFPMSIIYCSFVVVILALRIFGSLTNLAYFPPWTLDTSPQFQHVRGLFILFADSPVRPPDSCADGHG